ncbi:MAG: CopG family transcriptional regulator [bacterium]|nr:CopG family transcriptional regulator [bacterium]
MSKVDENLSEAAKPRRREQVGITLTEATKKRLEKVCEITGMNKSSAISLCINTYAFEKLNIKDDVKG